MKVARTYTMTARADSTARTAEKILQATRDLFADKVIAEITLSDIAARSDVTVQTVLRRFGDKDGVFAAAFERFADEVFAQRNRAVPNMIDDIVANLVEHYEAWGPLMLKMLSEESTTPGIRATLAAGRDYHLRWCETVFADTLAGQPKSGRHRRLAQLVAICDLRTWETLRVELDLSPADTRVALTEMLDPLIAKD